MQRGERETERAKQALKAITCQGCKPGEDCTPKTFGPLQKPSDMKGKAICHPSYWDHSGGKDSLQLEVTERKPCTSAAESRLHWPKHLSVLR
jgi:hypothetical protein